MFRGNSVEAGQGDTTHLLGAMRLADARRNGGNLAYMLDKYHHFDPKPDAAVETKLAQLRIIATSGLEIEQEHGRGALLRFDHPWTASLIEAGLVAASRVSNAQRYTDLVKTAG